MTGEPGAGFAGRRPAHAAPERWCNAVGRLRSEPAKPPPSRRSPHRLRVAGQWPAVTGSIARADRVPDTRAAAPGIVLCWPSGTDLPKLPARIPARISPFDLGEAVPELSAALMPSSENTLPRLVLPVRNGEAAVWSSTGVGRTHPHCPMPIAGYPSAASTGTGNPLAKRQGAETTLLTGLFTCRLAGDSSRRTVAFGLPGCLDAGIRGAPEAC